MEVAGEAVAAPEEAKLNRSRLRVSSKMLESEMEEHSEERHGLREVLLWLLLPNNHLVSLPWVLSSGFLHLMLLDMRSNTLTMLGPELLALSGLCMLLARNNRFDRPDMLPKGLTQTPLSHSLQVLNLSGNCF
ncbi:Leucine-rich repeat-containing protein 58 [Fukomys damarensis]|uniref:Leucine-rich repeat-containing protein 58 n=1 Tax=Fukomys damarensis TaxID=885580 RepID=A0A091CVX3_FUKDA|nr:Leucine-rich repeat-containing protein 58 [Fukomys damarensis]